MRIYLCDSDAIIEFEEGTGDNLLKEDIEAGYVDYVDYTVYDISDLDDVREIDGGMMLLEEPYSEHYKATFKDMNGVEHEFFDDDAVAKDVLIEAGYSEAAYWIWM